MTMEQRHAAAFGPCDAPDRVWIQGDTPNHADELWGLSVEPMGEVRAAFVEFVRLDTHEAAIATALEEGRRAAMALRDVLAGKPVRNVDEIIAAAIRGDQP